MSSPLETVATWVSDESCFNDTPTGNTDVTSEDIAYITVSVIRVVFGHTDCEGTGQHGCGPCPAPHIELAIGGVTIFADPTKCEFITPSTTNIKRLKGHIWSQPSIRDDRVALGYWQPRWSVILKALSI